MKNFYDFLYFSLFRYDSDLDGFKAEARACVQEWKDRIYEPASSTDPHFPVFSPYQAHIHEAVRADMMAEARKHEVICIFLKILKCKQKMGFSFDLFWGAPGRNITTQKLLMTIFETFCSSVEPKFGTWQSGKEFA